MTADSPAERAGLKAGDIVTKVDEQTISDSRALQLVIGQMTPGRTVRLMVIRDGAERQYSVTLGEQPANRSESAASGPGTPADRALDGVSVETLTPELARQYGLSSNTKGVVVRRIDRVSAAAQAGLEQGDVILEANRQPVTTVEQLKRYINQGPGNTTLLFVSHDGRMRYVVISTK